MFKTQLLLNFRFTALVVQWKLFSPEYTNQFHVNCLANQSKDSFMNELLEQKAF